MTNDLTTDPATRAPDEAELDGLMAYWNAANYLTVAQIYLRDNGCSVTGAPHLG